MGNAAVDKAMKDRIKKMRNSCVDSKSSYLDIGTEIHRAFEDKINRLRPKYFFPVASNIPQEDVDIFLVVLEKVCEDYHQRKIAEMVAGIKLQPSENKD